MSGTTQKTRQVSRRGFLAGLSAGSLVLMARVNSGLAQIADPSRGPANIAARIIHGFHDEAKHCGEMYLLLKLCRIEDGV